MNKRSRLLYVVWLSCSITATLTGQEMEIPRLTQRMTDISSTLTQSEQEHLESKLRNFEQTSSTQIVVLMVPTIGDNTVEDIAIRVAEKNLIGQKGRDNGLLLLIAKNDRLIRIEVGYGLEGVVTDALSGQIIRNVITPSFREGRYYEGISAGIEALMAASKNEFTPLENPERPKGRSPLLLLFFLLFFLVSGFVRRRSRLMGGAFAPMYYFGGGGRSRSGGGSWGGGGFMGGGGSFGGGGATGRW